ncbi:MAG TPA: hydrogenase maturation nickel metallochaperone HypA [Steroidobacteraceae bacterium]|nr:hydrogenase maturation nickel metallochaperone HypA [Steroidobacteraceae bacterium]
MHELSICQALLDEVAKLATSHAASGVERITLEVGPLSGVEPELLERAFEIARVGTCAARAELAITVPEIMVRCNDCGAASRAQPNRLLCAACGGYHTRVLEGDELRLRAVELDIPEARSSPIH